MPFRQFTLLLGPVAIRDLVVGTGGVTVGGLAFAVGCAYAGMPALVWFTLLGIVGIVSLGSALPVMCFLLRQPPLTVGNDEVPPFRLAA